jgi:hypothetical protein
MGKRSGSFAILIRIEEYFNIWQWGIMLLVDTFTDNWEKSTYLIVKEVTKFVETKENSRKKAGKAL